jgi:Flp pilus assembly protein TadG
VLDSNDRESGQTIVLLAVMITLLLGVCGFVIDGGNWMVNRRQVQNAADAAALAGAARIPSGSMAATDAAKAQYTENGLATDSLDVTNTTYMTSNDSVTVTATRKVNTFFTSIFGLDQVTETATARATIESFTTLNGPNAMPWGVLQGTYVPGQPYSIYTKTTSNANNGALSLPYVASSTCPVPSGANQYQNEIDGTLQPCPITLGETLTTKPGDNSGPTAQGLNSRITSWETIDQIVQFNSDGTATLLDPNSPQLVLIPILTNPSGQSEWPNGTSSPMTVVGFAYFVITSCGDPNNPTYCKNNDGKQVNGVFVTLDSTDSTGTSGAYDPNNNTAYTTALTQ